MMKEEQTVWEGQPGQSNFYTTNEVAESGGTDATKLYDGLQVARGGNNNTFRDIITKWRFNQDTLVGFSQAKSDLQNGTGGFAQYYVSDYKNVLDRVFSIKMTNWR